MAADVFHQLHQLVLGATDAEALEQSHPGGNRQVRQRLLGGRGLAVRGEVFDPLAGGHHAEAGVPRRQPLEQGADRRVLELPGQRPRRMLQRL